MLQIFTQYSSKPKKEEGENRENVFQSIQQQINKAYGVDGKQAVAEMLGRFKS